MALEHITRHLAGQEENAARTAGGGTPNSTVAAVCGLVHPGPAHVERRVVVPTATRAVHIELTPGMRLIDAVDQALAEHEIDCAQMEFTGGVFDRISHCIPDCSPDGSTAMSYSPRRESSVPAQLLTASASVGFRDGERFMHCHASWLDADGVIRAGHLWPETTIGPVPMYAVMHALSDVSLRSAQDSETLMPVFTPHPTVSAPPVSTTFSDRAGVCRILPNEDITEAAEKACEALGFESAIVRASLGSFVGAQLQLSGVEQPHVVDGPATEVVNVLGVVGRGVDAPLSTILVDRHGAVHSGSLIRGHNLVAVTFEMFLLEATEVTPW